MSSGIAIKEYCWGCQEPIFEGEELVCVVEQELNIMTREWEDDSEHAYHPECVPSDSENENVYFVWP